MGDRVGASEGDRVGASVGDKEGDSSTSITGRRDGFFDGRLVGLGVCAGTTGLLVL